jgi:hypothetical protein
MNETIVIKLDGPAGMSRFQYFMKSRKKLPEGTVNPENRKEVDDGDRNVGRELVTPEGQIVTVLTKDLVFMGFSSIVQYSNGAVRRFSYVMKLYSMETRS